MERVCEPHRLQQSLVGRGRRVRGIGLVPTMGALHEGHRSLLRAARALDQITVASIFVNPTQFGPSEDFTRYPRPLERDLALLEAEDVDFAFTPPVEAVYLPDDATRVEVEGLSFRLCGASRPGHFRGVATVVMKLVSLVQPMHLYLGQKDAAQVAVIRRMLRDFFVSTEIVVCPIVRETDGVAMSSRNAYLSPDDRQAARALFAALRAIGEAFDRGERATDAMLRTGRAVLEAEPRLRLDYLAAVDGDSLLPVATAGPRTLFAVAAFAGSTRLIDNAQVSFDGGFRI